MRHASVQHCSASSAAHLSPDDSAACSRRMPDSRLSSWARSACLQGGGKGRGGVSTRPSQCIHPQKIQQHNRQVKQQSTGVACARWQEH